MKTIKEKREDIKNLLISKRISEFAKRNTIIGNEAFIKAKNISLIGDIETMKPADGMYRAKKIADAFCNCRFANEYEIEVDTYLAHTTTIPILKIGNVRMTIKSVKDIDDIKKNVSGYMMELVTYNINLENQTNMFAQIDGNDIKNDEVEINEIYYGILAYHFDISNDIEHITMVFYDSKFEEELLRIETPKDILITKEMINHEDKSTLDENNMKKEGESLREVLELK